MRLASQTQRRVEPNHFLSRNTQSPRLAPWDRDAESEQSQPAPRNRNILCVHHTVVVTTWSTGCQDFVNTNRLAITSTKTPALEPKQSWFAECTFRVMFDIATSADACTTSGGVNRSSRRCLCVAIRWKGWYCRSRYPRSRRAKLTSLKKCSACFVLIPIEVIISTSDSKVVIRTSELTKISLSARK